MMFGETKQRRRPEDVLPLDKIVLEVKKISAAETNLTMSASNLRKAKFWE